MLLKKVVFININCNVDICSFLKRSCSLLCFIYFFLIIFLLNSNYISAQCYNCINQNPAVIQSITPNTGYQTISSTMQGGNYALCNVETGVTYTWSTCNGSNNTFDTKLTLLSANGCSSSNLLAYNDNYSGCGNKSKIIWTATFTGVVKILLSEYFNFYSPCTSTTKVLLLEWEATTQNCFHSILICEGLTNNPGTLNKYYLPPTATINMGTSYSTNSVNNQIWFAFKIAQAGELKIDFLMLNYNDVNATVWGPIANLSNACNTTANNPVARDYYSNGDFQLTVNPTISDVGKYYIIMIFTSSPTISSACNISFINTTAGKIALCPPNLSYNQPSCEGGNLYLYALPAISGATYYWTGPNGFTSTFQNPVINNITSLNSGVYSCYYTTSYGISGNANISVVINPKPLTSNIYHN